jgi:hypothetical protein
VRRWAVDWFPDVERFVIEATATALLVCDGCRLVYSAARSGKRAVSKKRNPKDKEMPR